METGLEWERTGSWEIFEKYCGNLERHEGLNRDVNERANQSLELSVTDILSFEVIKCIYCLDNVRFSAAFSQKQS